MTPSCSRNLHKLFAGAVIVHYNKCLCIASRPALQGNYPNSRPHANLFASSCFTSLFLVIYINYQ